MRIGVAGAGGFVGSAVLAALGSDGERLPSVRIPARPVLPGSDLGAETARLLALWHEEDSEAHAQLVERCRGLDAVVNAAGLAAPGCLDDASLWAANAVLPAALAAAADAAGVGRLVQVSSAAVQGHRAQLDEAAEVLPETPYARSKAAGEAVLRAAAPGRRLETVIYRPASVMGDGRKVTETLAAVARLPVLPVGGREVPVPVALVENVGAAAAFLAIYQGPLPQIVAHPSEGVSIQDLVQALAGRRRRFVRVPGATSVVQAVGRLPAGAAAARRAEMFLVGQGQAPSSLDALGFEPPADATAYRRLGARIRAGGGAQSSSRARIVFVLTRSDAIGGAAVHVTDLAAAFTAAGHEVTVLVGGDGILVERLRLRGITVRPLERLVRSIDPRHDAAGLRELATVLRHLQPDVVSTHSSKAGLLGRMVCRRLGIPVLFTAHGWAFTEGVSNGERVLYSVLEALAGPLADTVVCVSENDDVLAHRLRIAEGRRLVIKNGVRDIPADLLADPARRPPDVVMVARFDEQKDHDTLLRAFAVAGPAHDATLTLVGNGPAQPEAEALAAELGVADRVRFLGLRHDVHRILAKAQVFALISRWEGLPRSILEAMRAGLPVVASDVGGVCELVDPSIGALVPRQDVGALSRVFDEMLADGDRRCSLGRAARHRYSSHHTLGRLADDTLAVYEGLLGRSLDRPPPEALRFAIDE